MAISEKYDALVPTTMNELMEFADRIAKSSLIPKEYQGKPADCLIAMSMGLEVGLKPVQALQSIAVINGRPSLWGTAARALVMASGQLQSIFETDPADVKKTQKARCEIVRKGFADPFVGEFSLEDARKAGLAVSNTYTKYLDQMLTWRAFHGAARKAFPDIYKGLAPAEEMQEMTPSATRAEDVGPITLSLDAPVTQQELDESKRQFPDESLVGSNPTPAGGVGMRSPVASERILGSAATRSDSDKPKRGRPPKPQTQEPQATPTTTADKATPPTPAAATGVDDLRPPVPRCGYCHEEGHEFNSCPLNAPEPNGAEPEPDPVLSESDQADIMKMARTLRPKSAMTWLAGILEKVAGVGDLSEVPVSQMKKVIEAMHANA